MKNLILTTVRRLSYTVGDCWHQCLEAHWSDCGGTLWLVHEEHASDEEPTMIPVPREVLDVLIDLLVDLKVDAPPDTCAPAVVEDDCGAIEIEAESLRKLCAVQRDGPDHSWADWHDSSGDQVGEE